MFGRAALLVVQTAFPLIVLKPANRPMKTSGPENRMKSWDRSSKLEALSWGCSDHFTAVKTRQARGATAVNRVITSVCVTLKSTVTLPPSFPRIALQLAFRTSMSSVTGTPSYLFERLLYPYVPSRTLRSSSANLYVPRTNLHFGSCSFHIAAPTVWNSLTSILPSPRTLNTFRTHLKKQAFPVCF